MNNNNNNNNNNKLEKERFLGFEKALANIRNQKKAGNKGLWELERSLLAIQNEKDETTRHALKAQYDKLMSPDIEKRQAAVRKESEARMAWMSTIFPQKATQTPIKKELVEQASNSDDAKNTKK